MSTSPPTPPAPPPPTTTSTTPTTTTFPQLPHTHVVGIAAVAAAPPDPAPRKFPAPCWTQEETLALIGAYQDKWYSLRRRNLRTADWEAVAEDVTRRCPNQSPPKTSAQCRHKMEKLRKRYRTEKQRIVSLPNHGNNSRFFGSSWVFFDLMDNMELGSGGSNNNNNNSPNNNNNNNNNNNIQNNSSNAPLISNVGKVDLEVKPYSMNMNVNANANANAKNEENNGKKGGGDLGKYFDEILLGMGGRNEKGKSQNHEFDVRSAPPHIKFKVKNSHDRNFDHGFADMNADFDGGDEYGGGGGMNSGLASGFKRKSSANYERYDEMVSPKMVALNGMPRKDSGSGQGSRARDAVVGEMVVSIKMLGEGLVKMEKMKMEMMREIEQMRMQMEIKRSEMILESQHLIVSAFVEGLKKHKKVRVMEVE